MGAGHRHGDPFDCMEQYASWKASWTGAKKAWCCDHRSLGCAVSDAVESFDCQDGVDHWQDTWDQDKMDWCCNHKGRGCKTDASITGPPLPAPSPSSAQLPAVVSCSSPPDDWEYTWSLEQKKHCHLKVYGCSFQVAHLLQWHDVKRHWCCQNEAIGCRIGASQDKTKAG